VVPDGEDSAQGRRSGGVLIVRPRVVTLARMTR
jgi:hypothetical protein